MRQTVTHRDHTTSGRGSSRLLALAVVLVGLLLALPAGAFASSFAGQSMPRLGLATSTGFTSSGTVLFPNDMPGWGLAAYAGGLAAVDSSTATPTLTGFTPTSGGVGTVVTLTGSSFTATGTVVSFNGAVATATVVSDTEATAAVPASATTGPIVVSTPGGTVTSTTNFTVIPAPTVTGFTPAAGPVGTFVTLTGTNFTGATFANASNVTFNGQSAVFMAFSSTQIVAQVPTGATTGPIIVTTPGGVATTATNFTVISPPTVTSFAPVAGAVGGTVTVTGSGFTSATGVSFNGHAAAFSISSDTQIVATVPAGATTGPITVTNPAGVVTSASNFTVIPVPTLTSFSPASGLAGSSVILTGTNFSGATAVSFNGKPVIFMISSDTQIVASVPTGAITGPITVTTPGGAVTSATNFTVISTPTLSDFTPASGPVGTVVTLTGSSFTATGTVVSFNGAVATATVVSDTEATATVPAGATTGPITVTNPAGVVASASNFTVVLPPKLTRFTPLTGPAGSSVTLVGANFSGATAVSFHGHAATAFKVRSDTQIIVTVPTGATSGPITVTTPGGVASSTTSFIVVIKPTLTVKLSGLSKGVLKLGKRVTASSKVMPANFGGKLTLTVQRERNGKWLAVTTVTRTITASGTYSWTYNPATRATYRLKAAISATATHMAVTTLWVTFAVK